MIAKQVPMKSIKKSDFMSLLNYLTDDQNKHERVGAISITHCQSADWKAAVVEVMATQGLNTRAEADKTYHLIVSFRAGERPDDKTLAAIESKLCEGLGYGEHQRVSVTHEDTDNLHLHIAINKIHPTRLTMHSPYRDYKTLGQLCAALELQYGLEPDNHLAVKVGSENRAQDMEQHTGVESLLGWIKRECLEPLQKATSWTEFHQVLNDHGLALKERGNGLVIVDETGLMVKVSSLAREFSKQQLVTKFGKSVLTAKSAVHTVTPKKKYEARPLRSRIDTTVLFGRYQHEKESMRTHRSEQLKQAKALKQRLVTAVKTKAQLKRATIKLTGGSKTEKRLLYTLTSQSASRELDQINQRYRLERQSIVQQFQPLQWVDWLRRRAANGDPDALAALRARMVVQGLQGNTIGAKLGNRIKTANNADLDSVTKQGTLIYRVGSAVIRDDGDRLQVSRGATREGLQAALQFTMARFGSHINVQGTAGFKAQIVEIAASAKLPLTFADAVLEHQRLALVKQSITGDLLDKRLRPKPLISY